jgi:hypothetical protein
VAWSAASQVLRQSRYVGKHRRVGGGAVRGLHCVLLCADLQAALPRSRTLEPSPVQGQLFQPERQSEAKLGPRHSRLAEQQRDGESAGSQSGMDMGSSRRNRHQSDGLERSFQTPSLQRSVCPGLDTHQPERRYRLASARTISPASAS